MPCLYFITHPQVLIDPAVAVTAWGLSPLGRQRMQAMLTADWVGRIGSVWCSTERKAVEAADILAKAIPTTPRMLAELRENDRSATGYLPAPAFEATTDAFFANPDDSIGGWETAADAQRRIVAAIATVLSGTPTDQDIAVVSHGAVGALLLCHLKRCPISRAEDQPGQGGGNYFCFDTAGSVLRHGWRPIDDAAT